MKTEIIKLNKYMNKTTKNKFNYFLIDLDDKCLILKLDFTVSWSKACEVIAMFSSEKKPIAEKLIQELNAGGGIEKK